MGSKDKDKFFQLKQFFKFNKGNAAGIKNKDDFILTEDMQRDLSRDSPNTTRIRAIRDICHAVTVCKLDDVAVAKIWGCMQDLLTEPSLEMRHLAIECLQCLVNSQGKRLNVFRPQIFRIIMEHKYPDDIGQRFELLQSLTDNGKDILYFDEKVGPFLLDWFPDVMKAGKTIEFMGFLVNLIKFNSAFVNEEVVAGFVNRICTLCCNTPQEQLVLNGLQLLDTIIAYYYLPSESLHQFVGALCRIVNIEAYCSNSWKVMKNLLGTHMGHSAVFTMCRILQEPNFKDDSFLIRGAIFFLKMGLWGTQPLTNLRCPPSSILPSILIATKSNHSPVTYELILCIQSLIEKFGLDLQEPSWEIILQILSLLIKQVETVPSQVVSNHIQETLTCIEGLIETGNFNGNVWQYYKIIEECASLRPEVSILRYIAFMSEDIHPTKKMWLSKLNNLLNKHFKLESEKRTTIRLDVLRLLSNIITINRMEYEDELIDRLVIPHLLFLPADPDYNIRKAGADLLVDLCINCETKRCLEMLDILEKLLIRPFEIHANDNNPANDYDTNDVKNIAAGLIKVFRVKIHKLPSLHAVRIYKILINHLEMHYNKPKVFENCNFVRNLIFDCFLQMRADSLYRLGCPDSNGTLKYSSYLCVTYRSNERSSLSPPPPSSPAVSQHPPCTVTYVPMKAGFKIFITCLTYEKDWDVFNGVLTKIPEALQNKSLILAKHGNNDIGLLVDTICTRIANYKKSPDTLNININRMDFFASVLNVIPALASYHSYLDPSHQQKIIKLLCTFKCGLGLKCFRQCITVLTICTLEMQDVMVKMLPEVLLILSKSSANVHIAIPVLEFLSTLTILPSVFSCFVADQYMAIFAILLPYTNPFKYNHYTVFLAHHVISVWFLKCRLPFRKAFVRFITNGLQANAIEPFEESQISKTNENINRLNQDSSDRKRSSSLTEQRSTRRERTATVVGKPNLDFRPPTIDKNLISFYTELTETCIDLMARYTFSVCSALPRRLPNAEFLLNGGQSMSWLLGNRVITVTTSGCSQKVLKQGLCDKCLSICSTDSNKSLDDQVFRTSRSGSNDKDDSTRVTRQNSGSNNNTSASSPIEEDKLEQLPSKLQQLALMDLTKNETTRCACWCQGWAEIYIRRPTGDMSWVMRIQNQPSYQHNIYDFPLNEVSTLFMTTLGAAATSGSTSDSISRPFQIDDDSLGKHQEEYSSGTMPISIPGSPTKNSPSRQSSRDSIDEDIDQVYEDAVKSRNPVRRSNSSPEMSASWKNPFMQKQEEYRSHEDEGTKKGNKNFSKDMRVSCEAIPEEIAGMGTTPPAHEHIHSNNQASTHPSLLSSLSYPGPPNTENSSVVPKPYQSVPPSPSVTQANQNTQNTFINTTRNLTRCSTDSLSSDKSVERPNNLPMLNLMPLSSKPPQSPTQTSPRPTRHSLKDKDGHEIQKSVSTSVVLQKQKDKKSDSIFNQSDSSSSSHIRDRTHTISVMSPARKPRLENLRHDLHRSRDTPRSGINPSFVFLQLYHAAQFGAVSEKPLLINSNEVVQRAVKVLDLIPPYETHKIGVIYIGRGQCNKENEILKNRYGSVRYVDFLKRLGTLIKLQDVDPQVFFMGGLDLDGNDGKFAYIWQDDVIRVMFHVATLMPIKESDPNCNNKKLHIGNNNVTIVYNESGEDYNINTIKGQFNFASIIIQPLDHNSNIVTVKAKEELVELIGNCDKKIVSDQNVAILARQLALHANLASFVQRNKSSNQVPYAPNWLERLRRIKDLRKKILQESKRDHLGNRPDDYSAKTRRSQMEDFIDYT